ncbi:MAG: hypothetical protein M3448_06140, partial [Pseudomonadota bacterium]|nr:hypothetical protein [Pseudomonadota bacterium]
PTLLPLVTLEAAMSEQSRSYHRQREQQCRELAQSSTHPEIRRRHEELAQLHASAASDLVSV